MKLLASDYSDEDLIARWEDFFETSDYRVKIMEVAAHYPEQRSVYVEYAKLDLFDPDMAEHLLQYPVKVLSLSKQAIRKLLPPGRENVDIHLRVTQLPRDSKVEIRKIRSEHLGKLIAVEGLVRKATEVRPKIVDALFQCARCGMIIKEPQEGMYFKEPMECYKEQNGCGRTASSTKFKLLSEESRYVDTQKVEIQENPEGLRGGAQPERLTGFLEEDLAGTVAPGDRLVLNGILRSVQKGAVQKYTLFDINLDVLSVELKTQEYEEVSLTEEDEVEILRQAKDPALFKKIVSSISPTIYGYEREKEAIALQLFGGVHKTLDDGTKIRGDIHILLVGDPGVAKCVTGDTQVWLADQTFRSIKDIVEEAVAKGPVEKVDDGVWAPLDLMVLTFSNRGAIDFGRAVRAWKRTAPPKLLRFTTKGGRTLTVTPTHPLFVQNGPWIQFRPAHLIFVNQYVAVATCPGKTGYDETCGYQRGLDWDQVVSKEEVEPQEGFVYDLEVEGTHNFVTNGIISHNSQILRYMSDLAPRGIYASGKSSSAAGLCVHPDTIIYVDGRPTRIGEFVEARLSSPKEVKPGVWTQESDGALVDSVWKGENRPRRLKAVWRISTPARLIELIVEEGKNIILTPETRVNARRFGMAGGFSRCMDLQPGDEVLMRKGGRLEWVRIKGVIEHAEDLPPYVYDLTVEESHTFVANDFVVHNTAAAVKDDFGEGRWTLEAGALVLADQGLAAIDELDKMSDQDRSSMHEAMESQSVSVAKAGITARLQCRCSILGAANPKYGRFEESQFIADQIDLPPALMSRFDLIFAMTDKPDSEKDARITRHILNVHRRGEILKNEDLSSIPGVDIEAMMQETSSLEPVFSKEFLRKYVAYSKRITPILSDEAVKLITENYLNIRRMGEGENKSVPITARQLEAYVRLAEASARARLSRVVTAEDARRAVSIVEYYLRKIAGEAGRLDIDIIATGTSRSQREQIVTLRSLIQENAERDKGISIENLIQLAEAEGIPEERVRMLLKRLHDNGEVYSPISGYYKLSSEGRE
ncbi:MAG: ATP-binding protein [Methanomassiliicoccales archaeon]